mgnify:CR=1 FL=1
MRYVAVIWLPLLLFAGCQRSTQYCEDDSHCPSGWLCGPGDLCVEAPVVDLGSGDSSAGDLAGPKPVYCRDIRAANRLATDGNYTLYVNGDGSKPWTAFCFDMSNATGQGGPLEYLTLPNGDGNFSQFTVGFQNKGSNVRTNYWRLRVEPKGLAVNPNDQTYATSTGTLTGNSPPSYQVTSMPYGVAMDCLGPGSMSGVARLDLGGTPFTFISDRFATGGSAPGGTATYSTDRKVVSIRGGGGMNKLDVYDCGWMAAIGGNGRPINLMPPNALGPTILLEYP